MIAAVLLPTIKSLTRITAPEKVPAPAKTTRATRRRREWFIEGADIYSR